MTLNLNSRSVLKYGIIWEYCTEPDSVITRPFIIPPPAKTESSSNFSSHVPEKQCTTEGDEFQDVNSTEINISLNAKKILDIISTVTVPYHTIAKKGKRFNTPWGRSEIDYPSLIIPFPGENSNILLFRVNSYLNSSFSNPN